MDISTAFERLMIQILGQKAYQSAGQFASPATRKNKGSGVFSVIEQRQQAYFIFHVWLLDKCLMPPGERRAFFSRPKDRVTAGNLQQALQRD